jgi:hypothetical protein
MAGATPQPPSAVKPGVTKPITLQEVIKADNHNIDLDNYRSFSVFMNNVTRHMDCCSPMSGIIYWLIKRAGIANIYSCVQCVAYWNTVKMLSDQPVIDTPEKAIKQLSRIPPNNIFTALYSRFQGLTFSSIDTGRSRVQTDLGLGAEYINIGSRETVRSDWMKTVMLHMTYLSMYIIYREILRYEANMRMHIHGVDPFTDIGPDVYTTDVEQSGYPESYKIAFARFRPTVYPRLDAMDRIRQNVREFFNRSRTVDTESLMPPMAALPHCPLTKKGPAPIENREVVTEVKRKEPEPETTDNGEYRKTIDIEGTDYSLDIRVKRVKRD